MYRASCIDGSGYVVQRGHAVTGARHDAPRGSGTAVAAYFLSFVDTALAGDLERALRDGERSILGFGAVRDYAAGSSGAGDGDSGPVFLGVSVAATGFALGAARVAGDRAFFVELYRTTDLFGLPAARGDGAWFGAGGPFGNAVLLAQLTANARTVR